MSGLGGSSVRSDVEWVVPSLLHFAALCEVYHKVYWTFQIESILDINVIKPGDV